MGHHGVPQWGHGSILSHFGPICPILAPFCPILVPYCLPLALGVQLGWDPNLLLPSHP